MEDKNGPEIDFKGKKEDKKKGFLPWLRQKLGLGGPSGGGAAGEAGMMNIGRGLGSAGSRGAGLMGRSGGLFGRGGLFGPGGIFGAGGLLSGNVGMIATLAVVAAVIGATMYMRSMRSPSDMAASGVGSYSAGGSDYIPAIQRAGSGGSSLDMLKEANKGFIGEEEKKDEAAEEKPEEEAPPAEENPVPDAGGDMAAKLQGFNATSLTTGLGGNSGSMPFGSKFGQGAFGPKTEFSNLGSGFANLPKYQDRKNKILAMGQQKKAVRGKGAAGKRGAYGKKAYDQARGVKATQQQYRTGSIDELRSGQDLAWEGQTGAGTPVGGGGMGDGDSTGGGGVATTPSIDNPAEPPSDGGDGGDGGDPPVNTNTTPDNPWGDLLSECMMLLLGAAVLAYAGGKLIEAGKNSSSWWGIILQVLGWIMVIAAILMCIKVIMNGIELMNEHGQNMLGILYIIGGVVGIIGAIATAVTASEWGSYAQLAEWALMGAGIIGLFASMASGS